MTDLSNNKINVLTQRDIDRKIELEKRQQSKNQSSATNETLEYFEKTFATHQESIETFIMQSKNIEKNQVASHLNMISKEISTLQKYLANSNVFLPSYELKKYQTFTQQLVDKIKDLEDELLPKRKFAFKKKKIVDQNIAYDCPDSSPKIIAAPTVTNFECGYSNLANETLTMNDNQINKKDVGIEHLNSCIVKLFGFPSTLHLDNLKDCKIFTGPVSTSIFVSNCENCILVIACQQLRLHNSKNLKIYLHVTSRAIMEDCDKITIAPYNLKYSDLNHHFELSGLDISANNWKAIDDFNWLNIEQQSPHWSIMDDNELIENWDSFM